MTMLLTQTLRKPLQLALAAAMTAATLPAVAGHSSAANTLVGWALLPAATFSDGPTSGQFASSNPYGTHLPPYPGRQPVQGFSAVLPGVDDDTFVVMSDNGFGTQANSADTLLRMYGVKPDFRTARGGSGEVQATNIDSGLPLARFSHPAQVTLNDVNQQLSVALQADYDHYYDNVANPMVDSAIRFGRLLSGADFDIESVRQDRHCNLWFGDEFGPYLLKTDRDGTVLRREIPLPGVYAPQHKDVVAGLVSANLGSSGGFEGMAINPRGDRLYTLLEKTVTGDPAGLLRINEFDIGREAYTGAMWLYPLDPAATAIGDMTAIDEHRFIVIERNGATATSPSTSAKPFKKLFVADMRGVANGGTVRKYELVDLMNIADPHDLNGDGASTFTFPYVTIEDVLILDERTLLVINDNNFPGGGGRALAADDTEFLKIRLAQPLQGVKSAKRDRVRCDKPHGRHD